MKSGYTLIELLITIAVMTIVMSIGTLSFSTIRVSNQLDLVAAEVRADLLRAQSEAINNIESGVYIEPTRVVYFRGATYVEGAPSNIETAFPSNISATSITIPDNTATFDPITGYLVNFSDPSGITLSSGAETHTIAINQFGLIALE